MIDLFSLIIYLSGFVVGTAVGSRVFYGIERRANTHGKVIVAYQTAVLEGAIIGLLWPVALPLLVIYGLGWQAARIAAPKEVRAEVSAFNTEMMERILGQKSMDFEDRYSLPSEPSVVLDCGCVMLSGGRMTVSSSCAEHKVIHR